MESTSKKRKTYVSPDSILERLKEPSTVTIDAVDAAVLLGISRSHCYRSIAESGVIAGIAAIRIGSRIRIPAEPMRRLLGISTNNTQLERSEQIEVDCGRQSI
jgi:hypothetical protein